MEKAYSALSNIMASQAHKVVQRARQPVVLVPPEREPWARLTHTVVREGRVLGMVTLANIAELMMLQGAVRTSQRVRPP